MTIPCRKIGKTPLDFSFESNGAKLEGTLVYEGRALISLKANLSGEMTQDCDVCCESMKSPLNEKLNLLISDGLFTSDSNELEDIIEVENGVVNIDDILRSELELIRSDYFVCENCKDKDGEYEF